MDKLRSSMNILSGVALILVVSHVLADTLPEAAANPTVGGFHGIWYMNQPTGDEYVYKYSGGLGLYPAKHAPFAVYAPEVNKTFFCYGGTPTNSHTRLWHMVSAYDHAAGTVDRPTLVMDKNTNDAHDNPVISIDSAGHVWIFSTSHGTGRPSYVYKSARPYAIDAFQPVNATRLKDGIPVPLDNFSYFQVWHVQGYGFAAFFTHYGDPVARTTFFMKSADGVSWSEWQRLAAIHQGHYQVSAVSSNIAGCAFNYHPNSGGLNCRSNLYYMETPDLGQTWRTVEGDGLTLPLTAVANDALVIDYQNQGLRVYMKELRYDPNGYPVILYTTSTGWQPGPRTPPRKLMMTRWGGAEWMTSEICEVDHNYDSGSLHVESNGPWRVVAPTGAGPQAFGTGGELEAWSSDDSGQTWTRQAVLTAHSPRNHTYVRRPVGGQPDFCSLWADGNAFAESESHLYFATQSGTVYRLPPRMTGATAEPTLWNVSNARGATQVVRTTATLRGEVTCPIPPPRVRVCWGTADGGTDLAVWQHTLDLGLQTGSFSATVSNLLPDTTHYYRCHTTNAAGESWADETRSFDTLGQLAIRDDGVTGVAVTMVELNGNVEGHPNADVYCLWGETDPGTNFAAWAHTNALGVLARGPFTAALTGLRDTTRYYYRLHAADLGETTWSAATTEFKTLPRMFDPSAWQYKAAISFPGYTRDETLTNFPVLVRLGENLAEGFYERCAFPNGRDLRFADAGEAVRINYDIEEWNTNGHSDVWVQVPELRRGTRIRVYWGNPNASSLSEYGNERQTWDATFSGVWHLGRMPAGAKDLRDATTNGVDTIDTGTTDTDGIVSGARSFARSAPAYLSVGDVAAGNFLPTVNTPISMACWARPSVIQAGSLQNRAMSILRDQDAGSALSVGFGQSTRIEMTYASDDNVSQGVFPLGTRAESNTWHYLVLTYGDVLTAYVNGELDRSFTTGLAKGGAAPPLIGAYRASDPRAFDGRIDEVRFSNVERSSNWVWATWMNTVSNFMFCGYGGPDPTAYEGFEYEGRAIDGKNGGFGWGGPWQDADGDFRHLSGDHVSLRVDVFPFPVVGARIDGSGVGISDFEALRPLAGGLDFQREDDVLYFSCLMRKDATNQVSEKVELGFTSFTGSQGVAFGLGSTDTFYLRWLGETSLKAGVVRAGETYFLVGKVTTGSQDPDRVYLRAYASGQTVDAEEPDDWTVRLSGSKTFQADHLWVEFGRWVTQGQVDEVRIGKNWAAVTRPPVPMCGTMIIVR